MRNKSVRRSTAKHSANVRGGIGRSVEKPVALTVKVDSGLYLRLSTLRATQRRTHQDILQQALEEYLDRAEA